ncbi:hypothetical protein B5E87_09655 [Massilimicrobiota sp. An142]|uniref:hypothetical protein n=1 Tax=Massilimicrobiota sp. An142 TaxID=1965564 RepID=UPI000B3A7281|nr:hypothetical protein [Massilimicrobiota sp. An142]OUQ12530.1 hypothetical protein B5E87_09655 [Massilimicrobiota sp. An142]
MKAFGYDFNVGIDSDKGGVVFDKTIEEAINQIKQDIQNEYKNKDVERALASLQVYDLELAI